MIKRFAYLSTIVLSIGIAESAITALTPNSVSASTSFNDTTFDETNLYDGNLAILTVGTTAGLGAGYAGRGNGPHVLVFDYGSVFNFDTAFYAQRLSSATLPLEAAPTISVWFEASDPGSATVALPGTLGTADAILSPNTTNALLQPFNLSGTGRYVVVELAAATGGNPGGEELRFNGAVVPEPSSIALLGLAGLGLLRRRRV